MQLLIIGTNCRLFEMGRIVVWDKLSLRTNCRLGRIVAWDELSLGTNCRLGRIAAFWNLGRIVAWDESSLGTNCRFTLCTNGEALSCRKKETLIYLDGTNKYINAYENQDRFTQNLLLKI